MSWIRSEGSTTDVADPEGKMKCTPKVPAPPRLGCFGKGWWTMLGWGLLALMQMWMLVEVWMWMLPPAC